ncbi:MAG TPA: sigma-70 family RNA polymerase sigma factor [Planctomycetota bacterium]|nr:sigma-70 family RNA polymerase sigma factor [Planctomycetota bacterium]
MKGQRVLSDEEIEQALARAQAGDSEAYGLVVYACQARLRAFVARYVLREAWVDDIVQQAFVTAYQNLHKFELNTDFPAWLRTIAFNHLRRELAKASRRHDRERDYVAELAARELSQRLDKDSPRDDAMLDALRDCVSGLPQRTRTLLSRYYEEGLPLQAIAEELDRAADGLKVTLFRVRAQLKACIEQKLAAGRGDP